MPNCTETNNNPISKEVIIEPIHQAAPRCSGQVGFLPREGGGGVIIQPLLCLPSNLRGGVIPNLCKGTISDRDPGHININIKTKN